jgi:hypothetical protein
MEFEVFSSGRWAVRRNSTTDNQDNSKEANDDYFCWRWYRKQFSSDLDVGTIPSDGTLNNKRFEGIYLTETEQILQSILSNKCFYRFLIDYLYSINEPSICRLADKILEVYGEDTEKLASMWGWAKSSGAVSRAASHSKDIRKDSLSLYAFDY